MKKHKGVVIGGGTMGTDIASIFIANGHDVEIVETNNEARENLAQRVEISAREIGLNKSLGIVRARASIGDIDWNGAYLLIECVSEVLALKQEVFAKLDKVAPRHLPLTSNSSGFPISRIADNLETADRMVGLHFFMPAHLVPCVEVIVGERSDLSIVDEVHSVMSRLGRKPVRVNKDIPGFLGNRIQGALMREALALVDGGYATFEDIDTVVQYSFGFRFVAAGPMLQKDISGIQTLFASETTIFPTLDNGTEPGPTIQRLQAEQKFGMRSKEGFYHWDDETISSTKAKYNRDLQKALEILRDEDG
jgi:3-hydroxybutyryl-CoA dehydrogenase